MDKSWWMCAEEVEWGGSSSDSGSFSADFSVSSSSNDHQQQQRRGHEEEEEMGERGGSKRQLGRSGHHHQRQQRGGEGDELSRSVGGSDDASGWAGDGWGGLHGLGGLAGELPESLSSRGAEACSRSTHDDTSPDHSHSGYSTGSSEQRGGTAPNAFLEPQHPAPAVDSRAAKRGTRDHSRDHTAVAVKRSRLPDVGGGTAEMQTDDLHWNEMFELLQFTRGPLAAEAATRRPHILTRSKHRQVFLERPRQRRKPSGDKWLNSGGKKGSTVRWANADLGIRKRYGKCVPLDNSPPIKFMEYSLVACKANPIEDKSVVAFVLEGPPPLGSRDAEPDDTLHVAASVAPPPVAVARSLSSRPAGSYVFADTQPGSGAVIDVHHHRHSDAAFLSFLADQTDGTSLELGAIVRQKEGVTLESRQGDFAEWHQRKTGERPFTEGDVVGFGRHGEISRRTNGAYMLGVISRQAVVEGSMPASRDARDRFDTVAYVGIVPVKVRRDNCPHGPCAGDILVPSGRNDGTAVVVGGDSQKAALASQKLAVVLQGCEWSRKGQGDYELVSCAVVSPTETSNGNAGRRPTSRLALWSGLTILLTLIIGACIIALGVANGIIQSHAEAAPLTAAELACAAAIRQSCLLQLQQVKAADEVQNTNKWVPSSMAHCTTSMMCADRSPCRECTSTPYYAIPNAVATQTRDPRHPLRTESDPACLAEFSNPVDPAASLRPESSEFKQLVWTRCPNVQVPGTGKLYYDHGCYPGKLLHSYSAENISSRAQQDCEEHGDVWEPITKGVCLSLTGHPIPNVTSEADCTRRYGVDPTTLVDLRNTCANCGKQAVTGPSCSSAGVVEKVCGAEIVPKLASSPVGNSRDRWQFP